MVSFVYILEKDFKDAYVFIITHLMEELYTYITRYFDNPRLQKDKDTDTLSIYICQVFTQLSVERRYLIVLVPRDVVFVGEHRKLSQLKWESFQTRTMPSIGKSVPVIQYNSQTMYPENQTAIHRVSIEPNSTLYSCFDFPIQISMLHHDGQVFDYPERATLRNALETFHTVIFKR